MTDNTSTSPYRDAYDEDDLAPFSDPASDVDVDDHRFGDVEASDVFVELIQRNPEVCSNCFLKIRDVWFPHAVAASKRGRNTHVWKSLVRYYISKPDRVEDGDGETARNPPKACANCGSISNATMRPLPKERVPEYAANLSRTLAGFGVEHNPLLLVFVVVHRKRFPDFGSTDGDNFRVAVEYAIDETSPTIEDVLVPGPTDPARTDDDPVVDRPALPAGTGDRRRRVRPFVAGVDRVDEDDRDVEADADVDDVERASPLADGGQR
ncbi:hypothetical protein DJ71_13035 [Halorubrum sp. E3]|nr:hypothetical protein DJ71_13035 [Halorubrum sp. E3]